MSQTKKFILYFIFLLLLLLVTNQGFGVTITELIQKTNIKIEDKSDSADIYLDSLKNSIQFTLVNNITLKYYYLKSLNYYQNHEYEHAIFILKKIIKDYNQNKITTGLGEANLLLAQNLFETKNYNKAIEYGLKALQFFDDESNLHQAVAANLFLSTVFIDINQLYLANEYIMTALQTSKNLNSVELEANCFFHLSLLNLAHEKPNIGLALHYLYLSEKLIPIEQKAKLALIHYQLANYYSEHQNNDSTLIYLDTVSFYDSDHKYIDYCHLVFSQAKAYQKLGQIDVSKLLLNSSTQIAIKNKQYEVVIKANKMLADIYYKENQFDKAYQCLELAYNWKDTVNILNNSQASPHTDTRFSTILIPENNQSSSNKTTLTTPTTIITISIVCGLLILLIVFLISIYTYKVKTINQRLRKINTLLNIKNAELNKSLDMRDKLISTIAHDIKNPLGIITGFSELILLHIHEQQYSKVKSYTQQIHTASTNLFDLLNTLLQWFKAQNRKLKLMPEALNIKNEIAQNITFFESMAKIKNITLRNECNNYHMFYADKTTINTAFRNIINNAIKFTDKNGIIRINSELKCDSLLIHVQDNGIGIDSLYLDTLFEPIDKSQIGSHSGKGTGIGLNLCYEFIKLNSGDITVHSRPNIGTCFTISLPASKSTAILA